MVSQDNDHPRVDTSQHDAITAVAAADVVKLADDQSFGEHCSRSHHQPPVVVQTARAAALALEQQEAADIAFGPAEGVAAGGVVAALACVEPAAVP